MITHSFKGGESGVISEISLNFLRRRALIEFPLESKQNET